MYFSVVLYITTETKKKNQQNEIKIVSFFLIKFLLSINLIFFIIRNVLNKRKPKKKKKKAISRYVSQVFLLAHVVFHE